MVLNVIKYIGEKLLVSNPYLEAFAHNCIKLKDGEIVNFIGEEKQHFGPSDIIGIAAYTRLVSGITYNEQVTEKRFSDLTNIKGSVDFRLVVFQIGRTPKLHPGKAENKIWGDLYKMEFGTYAGPESEIKIQVKSSILNFYDNFVQEIKGKYNIPADAIIIALNCNLTWTAGADNCESDCDVYEENDKC